MVLVSGHNCAWQLTYRFDALEAGVVNRVAAVRRSPAGKGVNVARVLSALGADATLLAYLGGANGERIRSGLESEQIVAEVVTTAAETRVCVTLLTAPGQPATELVEPPPPASVAERRRFQRCYQRMLKHASAVVIAGTAIGGEPPSVYADMIEAAHRRGIITLLDAYRSHGKTALAAAPDIIKVNADELAELVGAPVNTPGTRLAAYRALRKHHGVRWLIVTLGERGIEGFEEQRIVRVRGLPVDVVNPIGSGDAVAAGIMLALTGDATRAAVDSAPAPPAAAATGAGGKRRRGRRRLQQPIRLETADLALALRAGAACGTANCLSLAPGTVTLEDYRRCFAATTVEVEKLG